MLDKACHLPPSIRPFNSLYLGEMNIFQGPRAPYQRPLLPHCSLPLSSPLHQLRLCSHCWGSLMFVLCTSESHLCHVTSRSISQHLGDGYKTSSFVFVIFEILTLIKFHLEMNKYLYYILDIYCRHNKTNF